MSNIESITQDLRQLEQDYTPLGEVRAGLEQKEIAMIVGPFAVGKTTIMEGAQALDSAIGIARSFTTRPPRSSEDVTSYDFLPYDEFTLDNLRAQAQAGKLVQFALHPTTGHVYGSELSSYERPYSLISVVPTGAASVQALPFKRTHVVGVTVPPSVWLERFKVRSNNDNSSNAADITSRLQEGVSNIEWSLDQADMAWIVNGRRDIADVSAQLVGVIKGHEEPSANGRQVAELLRIQLRDLLD